MQEACISPDMQTKSVYAETTAQLSSLLVRGGTLFRSCARDWPSCRGEAADLNPQEGRERRDTSEGFLLDKGNSEAPRVMRAAWSPNQQITTEIRGMPPAHKKSHAARKCANLHSQPAHPLGALAPPKQVLALYQPEAPGQRLGP